MLADKLLHLAVVRKVWSKNAVYQHSRFVLWRHRNLFQCKSCLFLCYFEFLPQKSLLCCLDLFFRPTKTNFSMAISQFTLYHSTTKNACFRFQIVAPIKTIVGPSKRCLPLQFCCRFFYQSIIAHSFGPKHLSVQALLLKVASKSTGYLNLFFQDQKNFKSQLIDLVDQHHCANLWPYGLSRFVF